MTYRRLTWALLATIGTLLGMCREPVQAALLGQGWPFRLPMMVQVLHCDAPGDNIAWAQFYTNSARLPDGRDLRVTTAGQVVMPMRIMRISKKDDRVRIAFAVPSSGTYYVWWGNPHPGSTAPELKKISRGVWLRLYHYKSGGRGSWRGMRQRLLTAKSYDSFFVPQIFIGFNPTGNGGRAMSLSQAWLDIPKTGRYTLAFDANSVGYLNLDGKNILTKANQSGFEGRVRFKRPVELTAGWHRVSAGQINFWGQIGVVFDWKPPGAAQYSPVPKNLFAPIAHASVGRLQKLGQAYTADFDIRPEAQVFVPPTYYFQRFAFQALVPASFSPLVRWQFSDGQHASGLRVDHEFIKPGIYSITMTVIQGGLKFSATRRIRIRSILYQLYPLPPADPLVVVARILKTYDVNKLNARELSHGIRFFRRYNTFPGLNRWGQAWAEKRQVQNTKTVLRIAGILAKAAITKGQFSDAADIYLAASQKPLNDATKAQLMALYTITACNYTDNASNAYAKVRSFLDNQSNLSTPAKHIIRTALAYAAIANGNGKLAKKMAVKAGPGVDKSYRRQEIQEGVLARNIESYIITGHFDTARNLINRWEWDYPRAMIKGYTRLLRMKLQVAEGRPIIAAKIGVDYVNALPGSFYAAELLYRAAQALTVAGKTNTARSLMTRLAKDYPESPYARKATKSLGQ